MLHLSRREFLEKTCAAALVLPARAGPATIVVPEFARTFEKALVCLPGEPKDARFFETAFRDLLAAVPAYSVLHVVARAAAKLPGLGKAVLHLVEDRGVEIELWAQDLGELVSIEGRERFLVAKRMSDKMGAPGKMSSDRKRIAELVFGESAVQEAPFVFEGGNVAFDDRRVLVGYNVVSRTVAAYEALGVSITRQRVLEDIRSTFAGMDVVEMGTEPQPPLLQHIDQAFVLLSGRQAVVCRLPAGVLEPIPRQLERYASQLRELGYRLSFLDHDPSDLERYRSSINVVPFVERPAGKKRILLPVFPGELEEGAATVERATLLGKAARAYDLYRELGYEPTPLRDLTHPLGGNTHCIVNVLS